ncbi:hypothetical protein [Ornithinimicrobium sufpigmenti]|uniref:hypothetical protein n=1 Tax=Ornithinimicrobium sufpigmenti TaxID=2508882 RepID=UPI0010362FD2|nr:MULTISPECIES: hypothetical protein [unclassified Ornithinimicrobium]
MTTDEEGPPTPVGVLLEVHHLLAQARAEATARARSTTDPDTVHLAFALTCLHTQALELLPLTVRGLLSQVPAATGADPLNLARAAERATRSLPAHQLPPGAATLVVRLIDTIRDQA